MQSFKEEVLDRSATIPVLVDFWAPWCGPCRVLGPVLERVAAEQEGRWELVKINTDQNPEISAEYEIRGIPAVKLFVDGKVVDEFTGSLPEPAVKQWLDKAIPSEKAKVIDNAREALESGDEDSAKSMLNQILVDEPTNPEACGLLARMILWDEPDRAMELSKCAATGEAELVRMASSVTELGTVLTNGAEAALPDGTGKQKFESATAAIRNGNLDEALEQLIQVITIDRFYNDDQARKLCIALFDVLGEEHPTTKKHRRMFDMSLY